MNNLNFKAVFTACLANLMFLSAYGQPFSYVTKNTGISPLSNTRVEAGDFDNDADMDLVISGTNNFGAAVSKVFRNNGDTTFTEINFPLTQLENGDIALADYNHDGFLDFVICGLNGAGKKITELYKNNNGISFSVIPNTGLDSVSNGVIRWLDFDRDGDLDLLMAGISNKLISGNPLRICKLYVNDKSGRFTERPVNIPGFSQGGIGIADFDGDKLIDIAVSGRSGNQPFTEIYYGDPIGRFNSKPINLDKLSYGDIAVADYNNDGWQDLLMTGQDDLGLRQTHIYRNNNGISFSTLSLTLPGVFNSASSWGDYDNDGKPDIVYFGDDGNGFSGKGAFVFHNSGNDQFSFVGSNLQQLSNGEAIWFDFDNDGDKDILFSGSTPASAGVSYLYRNLSVVPNSAPSVPLGIVAMVSEDSVKISWNAVIDAETPAIANGYNIWISTQKDSANIISPLSNLSSGYYKLPQLGRFLTTTSGWIKNLAVNKYYFKVQTVDNGFMASSFSLLDSFTVCKSISIGNDTTICFGQAIQKSIGMGTEQVKWYTKINTTTVSGFNFNRNIVETDTVWASLSNDLGCILYDTLIITMAPLPVTALPSLTGVCFKEPYTLLQGHLSEQVHWFINQSSVPGFTGSTFTGTAFKKDTLYTLLISPLNCINRDTTVIDTLPLPRFTLGADTALCLGQQGITLIVNRADTITWFNPATILGFNINNWSINPVLANQPIYAKAKDTKGCIWYDTINVKTRELPRANAGKDTTICYNFPHILGGAIVAELGTPPYTYEWTPLSDLTNINIERPISTTITDKRYTLTVTDSKGCTDTNSVKIKVNPPLQISAGSDREICIYDSTSLGGNPTATGSLYPYEYEWNGTGFQSSKSNPVVNPIETSIYTLIVRTRNGGAYCKPDTAKVTVAVNSLPVPFTTPLDADTTVGYLEEIEIQAFGGISYEWFPREGLSNASVWNPTVLQPETDRQYFVMVTDSNGCKQKDTITILVKSRIYLPNLFTPNDDNHNDVFKVYGTGVKSLSLKVYDRYGVLVYDSGLVENLKNTTWTGWDGTNDGKQLPSGTYQWNISGEFYDGKVLEYHGNQKGAIYLVR